jgi:ABC-type uncharacterized transport system substrate-binding protein
MSDVSEKLKALERPLLGAPPWLSSAAFRRPLLVPLVPGAYAAAAQGGPFPTIKLGQTRVSKTAGARHVDRILKGARPADIPVENRDVLEFVVNLKTAETLGLMIPEPVLRLQVTDVIQ